MNKQQQRLLGLTHEQVRVIETLARTPMTVAELSRETAIPKTTLNYLVKTLVHRGLLIAKPRGTRKLWTLQDADVLRNSLLSIKSLIGSAKTGSATIVSLSSESRVEIYQGAENLYSLWKKLSSLAKFERLLAIQPDASFNMAIEHILKKLPYDSLIEINKRFVQSKMIIEGIVHEKSADTIPKAIARKGFDPKMFLSGFKERLADTVTLPSGFLDIGAELYIYRDTVLIIQWEHEVGIRITDSNVAMLLKEMFNALKYLCKKYDQNERMAQKIIDHSESGKNI